MAERPQFNSSDSYVIAGSPNTWSADPAGRGRTGTQQLLGVDMIEPAADVREALNLSPGNNVVVRSRLILLDGVPVEIASSYYPAAIAAGTPLAGPGKIRGGAVVALAELGHAPADVTEQVTARWPTEDEAAILQIGVNEPLLVLTRTNRDVDSLPVEHAVNRMVARLTGPIVYRMRTATA